MSTQTMKELFPEDGYLQFKMVQIANDLKRDGRIMAHDIIMEGFKRWDALQKSRRRAK